LRRGDETGGDRQRKVATADLIIAATALTHDHRVLTRDAKSFSRIPELKYLVL
jgi:predicted nucleic acid-binding protein